MWLENGFLRNLSSFEIQKDLFLKNGLLYQKVVLNNHQGPISQFVLPKNFIHKVILACHDDKWSSRN